MLKAIRKLDTTKSQLQTYSWPIIQNHLITAYNKAFKRKHNEISTEPEYNEQSNLIDMLPKLSDAEFEIAVLKIEGYSIKEISKKINKNKKEITILLNSIYNKIKADNEKT